MDEFMATIAPLSGSIRVQRFPNTIGTLLLLVAGVVLIWVKIKVRAWVYSRDDSSVVCCVRCFGNSVYCRLLGYRYLVQQVKNSHIFGGDFFCVMFQ